MLLSAFQVGGGWGDADPDNASSDTDPAPDDNRVEAVVVDTFPAPDRPSQWLLVDLTDGATINGAFRRGVEAPKCGGGGGEEARPIVMPPFTVGETITFEPVETEADLPFRNTPEWESVVLVGARQLRVACPAGAEGVVAELAEHRATWDAAGIETYAFTLHWGGMMFHRTSGSRWSTASRPQSVR